MKVLYVSKASVVEAYRDKLDALAAHVSLAAIVPERWGTERTVVGGGDVATVRTARTLFHGHNHFHVYRGVTALLRDAAPDIVHVDEEPYSAVTLQLARACRRADVPFLFFAWQNLDRRLPPPFGLLRRHVFASAAAAIAGTDAAARVLHRAGWRGATAVIPQLGVSAARFFPDAARRAQMRARLGIEPDAFVTGFAGRLVPEKGVDLLLDAAATVDGAHVIVIGAGPERPLLVDRALAAGMAARTHFVGAVSSTDMPAWLNALDVLVLPSRSRRGWVEQFGRVLVEAMACGVAVVGAASGEIPAVIGGAGVTFAEDDVASLRAHLRALRDSPELCRALGERGRARALEHFTNERIAGDTVALYERVLGSGAGRAAAALAVRA